MIRYVVLSFVAIIIATLAAYAFFSAWPGHTSLDHKSCFTGMVAMAVIELVRTAFKLDKVGPCG